MLGENMWAKKFFMFGVCLLVNTVSLADPAPKKPNWIQFSQLQHPEFSFTAFYDTNSIKKSGAVLSLLTLNNFNKSQSDWMAVENKEFRYRSVINSVQIDCKYKTYKDIGRKYLMDEMGAGFETYSRSYNRPWEEAKPKSINDDLIKKICN